MSKRPDFLHPIEASPLHAKRERVFLVLAGLFLGSLTMLNILGVSRFITLFNLGGESGWEFNWGKAGTPKRMFELAVGVLPYPITFLCTDLISEFYGRRRANWVVTVGLILNIWVMFILWIGGAMPPRPNMDFNSGLPEVSIEMIQAEPVEEDEDDDLGFSLEIEDPGQDELERVNEEYKPSIPYEYGFYQIRKLAFGAVIASMIAYLIAQFTDVYLFHFWKRLTKGKHLWLRNNGSTLVSQLVDTIAVILITHFFAQSLFATDGMTTGEVWTKLFVSFILTGYVFKMLVALLDTIPFYFLVHRLKAYLEIDPLEHNQD